jgi:DNA-3-methyladenine glycosylase II
MELQLKTNITDHLKKDNKLAAIIEQCTLTMHKKPLSLFDDLLRSIVSQQLSTTAAATIYARFLALMDDQTTISNQLLSKSLEELRSVGLSYQKASYIQNVVRHFDDNNLYDNDWNEWTDEEIIHELTKIKGVGKWTVEMILMFSLQREDVLPLDDLIIRNNMVALYDVKSEKKQLIADLTQIAEAWRPYRSYACRYLWAAKDSKIFKNL